MLKIDAIAYYGSPNLVAKALGITRFAVAKWPPLVPKASAYELEKLSGGALKVEPELYKAAKAARDSAARAKNAVA